jgi:hypothetical protein
MEKQRVTELELAEAKRIADAAKAEQEHKSYLSTNNYQALVPFADDLKKRSEFADDAAYKTYLDRQANLYRTSNPNYAAGATPSAPGVTAPTPTSLDAMSREDLLNRRWQLGDIPPNRRTPAQMEEIARLDRALGSKVKADEYLLQ